LNGETNIFPSAVGRSYFQPILAPNTVHLGWNSWTVHWLSRNPVEVSDHVVAGFSTDEQAKLAVRQQAAQDWRDFLAARARELRPGAKLFCLSPAAHDDRRTWIWLFDQLWASILDMKNAGLLTSQEALKMTLPIAARTLADIKEPFSQDGTFGAMALELADVVTTPDPFWPDFQSTGDTRQLGQSWAGIWRGALGPTLASALDPAAATATPLSNDRIAVLDEIFSRFAARIAAAPQQQSNAIAIVVLRKI